MRVREVPFRPKGIVSPSFIDIRTGKRLSFSPRNNTLSYMSAEAMAAAFGGDNSYVPARIGFIYGDQKEMPTGESSAYISRTQDWDLLCEELSSASEGATIDVQVVGFSYSPSLGGWNRPPAGSSSSDSGSSSEWGDEDDYSHIIATGSNAITFHAISNSQDRGTIFDADTFKEGSYIYQCLLLGYNNGKYYILARASLKHFDADASSAPATGEYLQKPKGFEVAVDWTVVFH